MRQMTEFSQNKFPGRTLWWAFVNRAGEIDGSIDKDGWEHESGEINME